MALRRMLEKANHLTLAECRDRLAAGQLAGVGQFTKFVGDDTN